MAKRQLSRSQQRKLQLPTRNLYGCAGSGIPLINGRVASTQKTHDNVQYLADKDGMVYADAEPIPQFIIDEVEAVFAEAEKKKAAQAK